MTWHVGIPWAQLSSWREIDEDPHKEFTAKRPYQGECINTYGCCNRVWEHQRSKCEPAYAINVHIKEACTERIKNKTYLVLVANKQVFPGSPDEGGSHGDEYSDSFFFDIDSYSSSYEFPFVKPHFSKYIPHRTQAIKAISYEPYEFEELTHHSFNPRQVCETCQIESEENCSKCPIYTMRNDEWRKPFDKEVLLTTSFKTIQKTKARAETKFYHRSSWLEFQYERFFFADSFWVINEKTIVDSYDDNV